MATDAVIVESQREFATTPDILFATLADPASWLALDKALVDVQPREPLGAGSAGTMKRRFGPGFNVTTAWRNVEFVRDSRLDNVIKGMGYELLESVLFEPAAGGGTKMSIRDTLTPTSLFGRGFVAMSRGFIERDLQARLDRLGSLFPPGP